MASSSTPSAAAVSMRRISRDIAQLANDPLPGVSVTPIGDNVYRLHVNITVPEKEYAGIIIHMELLLPETYPLSGPAGRIVANFPYTQREHEHVHGNEICNDYLTNFKRFFDMIDGGSIRAGAGWTPAITLRGLCILMTHFFVDTDLPPPSANDVSRLKAQIANFKCSECPHTGLVTYPPFELTVQPDTTLAPPNADTRARENLMCLVSRDNLLDSPGLVLGFPINLEKDHRGRLEITLFPYMTCYDIYMSDLQVSGSNGTKMRTPNGHTYNRWLPVFISEEHFQRNLVCIQHTISVLAKGPEGSAQNDFSPEQILVVFPCLLNKMVLAMMNGTTHESENAILAYAHYHRLFLRLLELYPQLNDKVLETVKWFVSDPATRHKKHTPDIGEFLVKLSVAKGYDFHDNGVMKSVVEEYFARQVLWITKQASLVELHALPMEKRLEKTFELTAVSNKLLAFNVRVTKLMAARDIPITDTLRNVPTENFIAGIQSDIKRIKRINDYPALVQALALGSIITGPGNMIALLNAAEGIHVRQAYAQVSRPASRGQNSVRGQTSTRGTPVVFPRIVIVRGGPRPIIPGNIIARGRYNNN